MRKRRLEILLSSLKSNPNPILRFEEYNLDPESASAILYVAFSQGDIQGRNVVDLGSGIGILSIGAALLGAGRVVGIDIDRNSIKTATENMDDLGVRVELVCGTIECLRGLFDTTIMNPPFGSWKRGLDVEFLDKALEISRVVYSLHKASEKSDVFLRKKAATKGGEMRKMGSVDIIIPKLFHFHRKAKYRVNAGIYRTLRKDSQPFERYSSSN